LQGRERLPNPSKIDFPRAENKNLDTLALTHQLSIA
jgi:hypothetical protein